MVARFEFRAADIEHLAQVEVPALQAAGLRAGDSLGWLALNQPRALALLLACRRLGLRWVPLNTRLAAPELAALVQHAGLQAFWYDEALAPLAQAVRALLPLPLPLPPVAAAQGGHVAGDVMLVYTSGTTGQPKGAVHTGAGMDANLAAAIAAQGLGAHTRCLAVLPLFHVGGLAIQVLPTLAAGGVVRLHERFDAPAWFDDVEHWRPSTCLLVPAVMRALVEHPRWATADLSSLQFINSGSQIVPRALIDAFHARGVPVAQVYGSTETGPVSIVLKPEQALANVGRAGWPALGVQVRLAADGELLLQGPNLLRCYHRGTPAAFDADGWFHTGDLAEQGADGGYTVVGRSNELIISGGENIHPAEIEERVAALPGVAECAVVGLPDTRWGEVPVLVLVPAAGADPDDASLRAAWEGHIARYKWPRRIVRAAALPKTALGKVQREGLVRSLADSGGAPQG
jgi:fatty-acyl-CoA synthase